MEIHISRRRRSSVWMNRLAFRSTITAVMAMIASYVVSQVMPTIAEKTGELGRSAPSALSWLTGLQGWLLYLPLPGLILGFCAIGMRRLRPILAPLAALATLAAVIALIATLAASIVPMYQVPEELMQ